MVDYLLDTNAVVALLNGDTTIQQKLTEPNTGLLPIIVVGELFFGAENSGRVEANLKRTSDFVSQRVVLGCDLETTRWYGRVAQQLRTKGHPIPHNDMWIAALALQYGLTLLTKDSDFDAVDGLSAQDW